MVDKEKLNTISELVISLSLIGLVVYLVTFVPGVTADNIAMLVTGALVTRWLQKGAQQAAENQADKMQQAVQNASGNGGRN